MADFGSLQPPFLTALSTYLTWTFFFMFGHLRDLVRKSFQKRNKDYAPIRQDYEDFYTRRMYYRIHDCFNRPISSAPDAWIDILKRTGVDGQKPLELTGEKQRALNLGSYNYLGFAAQDEYCTPRVLETLEQYGWGACSSRSDAGTTPLHVELEKAIAAFVGKEDAISLGMGFATNSAGIPALVGKGCLILSDELNHSSIIAGCRGSGAKIKAFSHNDAEHLELLLRDAIARGQPRTHRPWRKIMIIVEGIYSMEGEVCNLQAIVAVKKKYKAYLYLDEAHSIGAMGANGRGVCEHLGVDPADVDVMMGTFTKSFGSAGGYFAADRDIINHLRRSLPANLYATAMSPPAAQQILSAFQLIMNEDGSGRGPQKIRQLHENSNFVRARLLEMGCNVLGDFDSPVMPVMLFNPGRMAAFSRIMLERGIAVVVVGFPATPLLTARARICISAAHKREDLEWGLKVMDEVSALCGFKFNKSNAPVSVEAAMDAASSKHLINA